MTDRPIIEPLINGALLVKNLKDLRNSKGARIETRPVMSLCRCGKSGNKPFCDGTHQKIGFGSNKAEDRVPDRVDTYTGKRITIYDNRCICSRAGYCTKYSPAIFNDEKEPWIAPDADDPEKTARTIRMCPSGALSYTKDGVHYKDQDRQPAITVAKNGPHYVVGGIELNDPLGPKHESKEHYTLCRCGASKNKPFCNGAHGDIEFKDDKN